MQPVSPSVSYPARFELDTGPIANWRPLVQWLLAVPHYVVLMVLGVVSQVVAIISWFAIVFTGRLPEGMAGVQQLYIRYTNRTYVYANFLREEYPPFTFDTTAVDPGDYPGTRTEFTTRLDGRNRLTVAFRWILVIPQAIVLGLLGIAASVAVLVAFFVVLFTGKWSTGLFDFVLGVLRWNTRVNAYVLLLTDEYPPFSLD